MFSSALSQVLEQKNGKSMIFFKLLKEVGVHLLSFIDHFQYLTYKK